MTKQTSQQKRPVKAEPVKSETSRSEETSSDKTEQTSSNEDFKKALDIDEPNERSEELAKLDLTEAQKDAAVVAARKDFLEASAEEEVEEDTNKPLNSRAQKLVDELNAKGIGVSYPSDFSKWDADTYDRLEKLNK